MACKPGARGVLSQSFVALVEPAVLEVWKTFVLFGTFFLKPLPKKFVFGTSLSTQLVVCVHSGSGYHCIRKQPADKLLLLAFGRVC